MKDFSFFKATSHFLLFVIGLSPWLAPNAVAQTFTPDLPLHLLDYPARLDTHNVSIIPLKGTTSAIIQPRSWQEVVMISGNGELKSVSVMLQMSPEARADASRLLKEKGLIDYGYSWLAPNSLSCESSDNINGFYDSPSPRLLPRTAVGSADAPCLMTFRILPEHVADLKSELANKTFFKVKARTRLCEKNASPVSGLPLLNALASSAQWKSDSVEKANFSGDVVKGALALHQVALSHPEWLGLKGDASSAERAERALDALEIITDAKWNPARKVKAIISETDSVFLCNAEEVQIHSLPVWE